MTASQEFSNMVAAEVARGIPYTEAWANCKAFGRGKELHAQMANGAPIGNKNASKEAWEKTLAADAHDKSQEGKFNDKVDWQGAIDVHRQAARAHRKAAKTEGLSNDEIQKHHEQAMIHGFTADMNIKQRKYVPAAIARSKKNLSSHHPSSYINQPDHTKKTIGSYEVHEHDFRDHSGDREDAPTSHVANLFAESEDDAANIYAKHIGVTRQQLDQADDVGHSFTLAEGKMTKQEAKNLPPAGLKGSQIEVYHKAKNEWGHSHRQAVKTAKSVSPDADLKFKFSSP